MNLSVLGSFDHEDLVALANVSDVNMPIERLCKEDDCCNGGVLGVHYDWLSARIALKELRPHYKVLLQVQQAVRLSQIHLQSNTRLRKLCKLILCKVHVLERRTEE